MIGISVIIPTYNRARFVSKAVNSVLAQTSAASEIIVVDDGSTDNTLEVLASYGTKIRVVSQNNSGVSAARNTGICAAQYEWVAFLDDDDEYAPGRLAIAAEGIQRNSDVDVHAVNLTIVDQENRERELFKARGLCITGATRLERPLPWVLKGCFFLQAAVVRRSALYETGLFRSTLYEDLDMFIRLSSRSPWIIDSRPCVRLIRRDDTGSLSESWRSTPIEGFEALAGIYRDALTYSGFTESDLAHVRNGLATYSFEQGVALLEAGNVWSARQHLIEAAKNFVSGRSRLKARAAIWGGKLFIGGLRWWNRAERRLVR